MSTYRSIFALLLSYGLLLVANGLFGTIVSLGTKQQNFSESIIGIVLSAYYLGLLVSSFFAVKVIFRIGHVRALAAFASIASIAALGHLLWANPVYWGVLRLISGFCIGAMIITTEGWLNGRASNSNRGTILALYMVTTYACAGSSQLILMIENLDRFKLYVIVSILFSLALLPILLSQSEEPQTSSPVRPNIKQLIHTSPVGTVGSWVVGLINGIFYSLTPIYAISLGLDTKQTAILVALGIGSGMLLQFPLGKLSDRVDRRWIISFSSLLTTVACYLLYQNDGHSIGLLYFYAVLYGCAGFSINPVCVAHTNDLTPADQRTQTASGLLMLYGIGAVLGPIVAGLFMQLYGANSIYGFSGGATFLFACYTLFRLATKRRSQEGKNRFVPFPLQSPARKLVFWKKQK